MKGVSGKEVNTKSAATALGAAAGVTLVLFFIPYGDKVILPLTLLSTYVHEMGHGLAAILVGGRFVKLEMWANGSGVAWHAGDYGALARAWVAAGGLLGPAFFGALLFALGRHRSWAKPVLYVCGGLALLSVLLFVRNAFGVVYVLLLGAALLALAHFASEAWAQLVVVFLGIQLSLSVFSRGNYLFMAYAETTQGRMPSDVAHISEALFLPYWFWGGIVGLISVGILAAGMWFFFRGSLPVKGKKAAS